MASKTEIPKRGKKLGKAKKLGAVKPLITLNFTTVKPTYTP
jgi:hypothetical protein